MTANAIESNLFSQVDQYGQHFLLFNAVIDSRNDGTQIKEGESFIHRYNKNKRMIDTTKGWEFCIQWKYGSSTWNQVKDVNDSFIVQLAEYAVLRKYQTNQNLHGV